MKNYLYLLLFVLAFQSCKKADEKDSFTAVNTLTVVDAEGNDITNKTYYLTYGTELLITPKVTNSLATSNEKIKFAWVIAGDTVSRNPQLKIASEDIGTGKKYGKLIVTDGATQANYSYNFNIIVSASISKGTFLLTEDEQHNAIVTMKSLGLQTPYLNFKEFNGHKLGKYPVSLTIGYKSTSATNKNYVSLITLVKESENPVMITDIGTLLPTLLYGKDAMIDKAPFNPTYLSFSTSNLSTNKQDGYVVVDGKARVLAKGLVGEDMYKGDPYNYQVGSGANVTPSSTLVGYFMGLYDQKNERIRLFGNNATSSRFNIFDQDYDALINKEATKGHTFLASEDIRPTASDWYFQFLTRKGNVLYKHDLPMRTARPYAPISFTTTSSNPIPSLANAVQFRYHTGLNFWYYAAGRTIYRFSYVGLDVQPYVTLPDDGSGDIVAWNFEISGVGSFTKLGIATYNPAAAGELKGSYYLYDIPSNSYEVKETYTIHKAVDLKIGL